MRLEGWMQGTDSRPSFETRVSAAQERYRYALLRMRVYPAAKLAWARKTDAVSRLFLFRNGSDHYGSVGDDDAPRVTLAIE
jgi:hypothetical protein